MSLATRDNEQLLTYQAMLTQWFDDGKKTVRIDFRYSSPILGNPP